MNDPISLERLVERLTIARQPFCCAAHSLMDLDGTMTSDACRERLDKSALSSINLFLVSSVLKQCCVLKLQMRQLLQLISETALLSDFW